MHSARILKKSALIAALVLGGSLSIVSCSASDEGSTDAGKNTVSEVPASTESPRAESPSPEPPVPAPEAAISLSALLDGDRAMQVDACNALLGSPLEIGEKLGYRADQVAVQMENEEVQGNPSSPWNQAATTTLVNGQVDLACMFKEDPNIGTTYVLFGTLGDTGENSFCRDGKACVISEDKQRVISVVGNVPEGGIDEAPLKDLLDKFTA